MIESLEAKLQERCESPGSSRPPSESSRSATSTSFVSDVLEPCSDGEAASECSQCPEEPTRLPGTVSWGQAAPLQCMAAAQSPTLTSLFICLQASTLTPCPNPTVSPCQHWHPLTPSCLLGSLCPWTAVAPVLAPWPRHNRSCKCSRGSWEKVSMHPWHGLGPVCPAVLCCMASGPPA